MESSLSSSSLPADLGEFNASRNENQTQEQLPCSDDDDENVVGNGNERQPHAPLPLSDTRSSSYSNIITALRRRRGRTEQVDRGQLLQGQLQYQQQQAQEVEREIVLPATNTTMSQKSLFVLRPVHRYADLVCIGLSVLAYLLETTMNAALAIFGIGVGVGLVLGDSFRAALPLMPAVQVPQQQHNMANATTTATEGGGQIFVPRNVPNLLPAQ